MDASTDNLEVRVNTIADNAGLKSTEAELTTLKGKAAAASTTFDSFNKSLGKFSSAATAVGSDLSRHVTLPIVAVGAVSVKMALDFQQAMTYVRTDAGDTTDNINTLSNAVLNLAQKSQFSPDELANGLYHLASLGLRGADAMNALNTAQQMAAVGGSDLESTASALGGALVSGINGVQNYTQAAGVLDATIGAGNMRMQDLVDAIGTGVLPVFKNAGLSITDFGAALATLTDNGQNAAAAATHLRMTISLMEAPSQAAQKALAGIGMTSTQMGLDMQTKGLIPALEDLQKHLLDTYGTTAEGKTKMAAALNEMFGGGKSSAAIQTLLDQLTRVQTKETQISQQSGEFSTKYQEQQATAMAQFKTAWSSVEASLIKLGDDLLPEVSKDFQEFSRVVENVSHWYESLSTGQKQFVTDVALVAAATGPTLFVFGSLAKSLSNILTLSGMVKKALVGIGGGAEAEAAGGLLAKVVGGGAAAASIEGEATAAAGLATVLTGPVGIALAGTAAAVVGGILLWKHLGDSNKDAAKQAGLTADQYKLSTKAVKDGSAAVEYQNQMQKQSAAQTATLRKLQEQLGDTQKQVRQKTKDLAQAEQDVTTAYDKYGANSPQYKDALNKVDTLTKNLTADQSKLKDQTDKVNTAESKLTQTKNNLKTATKDVSDKTIDAASISAQLKVAEADLKIKEDAVTTAKSNQAAALALFGKNSPQYQSATLAVAKAEDALASSADNATSKGQKLKDMMNGIVDLAGGWEVKFSTLGMSAATAEAQAARGYAVNAQGVAVPKFASGTNTAPAGYAWVGEDGPELMRLKGGEQIKTKTQSKSMVNKLGGSSVTNHIYVTLATSSATTQFFKEINNDGILASKGLTVRQGK